MLTLALVLVSGLSFYASGNKFEYITMDKSANVTFRTTEAKLFNSLDTTIALDTLERIKIENDIYIENTRVTAKSEEINLEARRRRCFSFVSRFPVLQRCTAFSKEEMNNRPKLSGRVLSWTGPSHWHAQGGQAAFTSMRQSARMGARSHPGSGSSSRPRSAAAEP